MASLGGNRPTLDCPPAVEHELAVNLEHLNLIDMRSDSDSSESSSDLGQIDLELNHLLSLKSRTQARETPPGTPGEDEEPFVKIGAGACGTIIAQPSKLFVVKVSKANQQEALWNDYLKHAKVAKCFSLYDFDDISIPACHYFVPANTPQYFEQQPGIREIASQCTSTELFSQDAFRKRKKMN